MTTLNKMAEILAEESYKINVGSSIAWEDRSETYKYQRMINAHGTLLAMQRRGYELRKTFAETTEFNHET